MNFFLLKKPRDEKQRCGDADAGVSDIEGGPPTAAGGHDFFKTGQPNTDKVDDITFRETFPETFSGEFLQLEALEQAVGEVAENAGQ